MPYNFDLVPDRNGTGSFKWDSRGEEFPGRPDAIPMWVADMDFPCPNGIVEAVQRRAEHPIYGYCSETEATAQCVSNWEWKHNHWNVDPSWITYTNGVVTALSMAVRAFAKPGEGVIIMSPVYYSFKNTIVNNQRTLHDCPMIYDGERWVIDYGEFERLAAMKDTKLFILCNPHNPLCRVFERDELERIGDICLAHNVLIMSDEIHADFVFEGHTHIPMASINEQLADITMTAIAPSKTFNIAGLQMSAVITKNPELRKKLTDALGFDFIPNVFGLTAFMAAYENADSEDYLKELIPYLWKNYETLVQSLKKYAPKIRVQKPEATYLMWIDCRELEMTDEELYNFFVVEAGVGIEMGHVFGGDSSGYVRMNIGCPRETVIECCRRIAEVYRKHIG